MLNRFKYALKQYPVFTSISTDTHLLHQEVVGRPILRPPPRPFLRPPQPLPFKLPPPKNYRRFPLPKMLMQPPRPPPRHLVVPRPQKKLYAEINQQMVVRPQNLMIELTLTTCKNKLVHLPWLTQQSRDNLARKPCFRVHGLRLCFLDDNNELCYLNHQNQHFLDGAKRWEETEIARQLLLTDLSLNHYTVDCIAELATIWYDDSPRNPIDFWIYQFLKHGYCALNDPMLDYASRVGNESLPLLMPSSSLSIMLPEETYELGPDFGEFSDFDLGDYLVHKGFWTNNYHLAEEFRSAVKDFCIRVPRLSFIRQDEHICLNDISILRTYPDGFLVDHPLSTPLPGYYFLMRMI